MSASPVRAADVEAAAERFTGTIPPTPLQHNERLSQRHGLTVLVKREDLTPVRSYKVRGAYNFVCQLSAQERERGVVCASAGNHAQGVAFACESLGVRARVYLPRTTPRQKRQRVARFGGRHVEVIVQGDTYDDADATARRDAAESGMTLVPAFDDPRTIAGQGTVVREVVAELGAAPDAVIVPVGGGGLLAGTAAWLRERHPQVRIIGAEPAGAASMALALRRGEPSPVAELDPFVDGAAVRVVGRHPFELLAERPPELVAVPEGRICQEILDLYQNDGIISEPAGALSPAALAPELDLAPGSTVVSLISGGNNDVSRYNEIIERALVFEGRKHYFLVEFPQEPGALRRFLDDVLGPDDDITRFEYVKRNNRETGPALVGVELGAPENLDPMLKRMDATPLRVQQLPPDSPMFNLLV